MKLFLALGLGVALGSGMSAQAAETQQELDPAACHAISDFTLPAIPWVGKFIYKISIAIKDGRPSDVDVSEVRGPDRVSNRTVQRELEDHIRKTYVCDSNALKSVFYLALDYKHSIPGLAERRAAREAASGASTPSAHQQAAASAAIAETAGMAAGTLVPIQAGIVCTAMGKPNLPRVNAVGKLVLSVVAEVVEGKVAFVDAKLKIGSVEPSINKAFIDEVTRTLKTTYVCPGNHVFKQEFQFSLS